MVLAAVVFAFGLVSRRLEGTILTAPIVFVVAGAILGPAGLALVGFNLDDHTVLLVGEIALAIVLFTDAARTGLSALRQNEALPLRLLGIGMPLTIALGTASAALLLTDLTFWEAAIVGAVLAPTDAALGQAVLSNPRVPVRVRQALNVEAGLNDGLSVPFLALFLTLAVAEEELKPATYWIRFALEQVGLGILVGIGVGLVGGWLVSWASNDSHAAGGAFPAGDAPARGFGAVYGLVRPPGARIDSAGSGRGDGGSAARRARRDRGGGGADGAAQRTVARGKCCPALGRVRPPGRRDGRERAGEERNGRAADACGLCVNQ